MKRALPMLKRYFIPHKKNNYQPHFFREASVIAVSMFVLALFCGAVLDRVAIVNSTLFADIFPRVLVELANNNRIESQKAGLTINPLLERAAQLKANDMAAKSYFAHTSPEGVTPWHWFQEAGYSFEYAGENLAVDFSDSVDVDRAWMNSPGHRANILSGHFTEIGIAMAEGMFQGRKTTFVVQMFGKPKTVRTAAAITPISKPTSEKTPAPVPSPIPTPTPTPSPALTVLGSSVSDQFVAAGEVEGEETEIPVAETATERTVQSVNFVEKAAANPKRTLSFIYAIIAAIVAIALLLMIVIKIKIQHPKNIAYGAGILALIVILILIYQALFPAAVTIV